MAENVLTCLPRHKIIKREMLRSSRFPFRSEGVLNKTSAYRSKKSMLEWHACARLCSSRKSGEPMGVLPEFLRPTVLGYLG